MEKATKRGNQSEALSKEAMKLHQEKVQKLNSIDFSDEDFIVFSLQQDGANLQKPGKHEYRDCTNTNSGISRKLIYGATMTKQHSSFGRKPNEEHTSIDTRNKREFMTYNKKVKEKPTKSVYKMEKSIYGIWYTKRGFRFRISNQSDASSISFAFPVLSWDGRESPAKMPKPETFHFWKHKKWDVCCLCKRF